MEQQADDVDPRRHRRPDPDADADRDDGRNETLSERSDRNWNEMLQETRIVQTGTQILSGFLLTIAFQPRFSTLTTFQHVVYLALVAIATLTTAMALTPVVLHRRLFRRHRKPEVVRLGHRFLVLAMSGLGLVMTGTVLLIFDVAAGRTAGAVAAVAVVVLLLSLAVGPARVVLRAPAADPEG
ncbi:hypothetical protein FHX74_002676 [Friedmanniella endophytica]|uniref:Sodium:proton antiporter n=1 Tax=Microlunatus kandeliicorticis TaxID=1759536 RepID=A0A7W3ITR6_9ACTN|nr:DUF6328 family protein [Microlunatus kandeliicorticis]MBA8795048.1 hypothetical protein [Microlunatus kandeliicorticis]